MLRRSFDILVERKFSKLNPLQTYNLFQKNIILIKNYKNGMTIRDIEKGELIFTEQVFSNLKVGLGKVSLTNSKFLKINGRIR